MILQKSAAKLKKQETTNLFNQKPAKSNKTKKTTKNEKSIKNKTEKINETKTESLNKKTNQREPFHPNFFFKKNTLAASAPNFPEKVINSTKSLIKKIRTDSKKENGFFSEEQIKEKANDLRA